MDKATSDNMTATHKLENASKYRRIRSASSSKAQRQYFIVEGTSNDDFRRYRKFSAEAGSSHDDEGIVMSLIRRCRSRSSSRSSRRHRRTDDDDDDDCVSENIELSQLSGFALSRLADNSDAGHKFITVYVDVPVWCDKCGHLIIGVYGHYVLCQCKCNAPIS